MKTLIAFATAWGSKYGGINSFNTDFLTAFGVAYHNSVQVICIAASATPQEIEEARNAYVILVPLPYPPQDKLLTPTQAQSGIDEIKRRNISFEPANTVWLGHDRITGAAAVAAAKAAGGRSALIHHMSYDHYESFAENSKTAFQKTQEQISLFQQADLVLAIGPLLRDALSDRLGSSKPVHMLIPGLAEIDARSAPKTFTAFLSGRLSDDVAKIKQGHLGVAAFAKAHCEARKKGMPDGLCRPPKLVVRGIDFDSVTSDPETELKKFAEEFAECVINLQALPYTQERKELHDGLASASVALMPSWHEGFGLVAWEAIAAGVPLIISKNSGVYQLLDEEFLGAGTGCVYPINVAGKNDPPYFREDDLDSVVSQINMVAQKSDMARRQAGILRNLVGKYTWAACAEQAAKAFDWSMQKGIIPTAITNKPTVPISATPIITSTSPLSMPSKQWQVGGGVADSQLLRAEEALVPFDPARQPELNALKAWLDDTKWPLAVRLITGAGGLGKTRLALELYQRRLASGWHAGFLDTDLASKDMATCWETLQKLNQPTLIVIDYAETRQPELLSLIKAILQNKGNLPVRMLLLARDGGEWWDNLPSKDPQCESLLNGYATSGPFCLPALHASDQDRRKAYLTAQYAFANALGVSASDMVPELAGEHFDRPLYLQMAALLALHGERPTTAEGLTKALLNHERRYWRGLLSHFAFAEPERHAQDLLALATLAGGFATQKDAQSYWATVHGNSLSTAEFHKLFHALVPLYPGKQGLQAVRPDILGEALVAQALLSSDKGHPLDAVLSNSASQAIRRNALTVLARLSDQYPGLHETMLETLVRHYAHCYRDIVSVALETSGLLPALAEAAFTRLHPNIKSQVAGLLLPLLNDESVKLAELSCSVTEYLADKSRQKMQKKQSIDLKADYAGALLNYAVTLNRVGHFDQALSNSKEASDLFNHLKTVAPKRFEPKYANSLNNYANRLSDTGAYEAALIQSKQALDIRQRLAQKNPEFEPDYAVALGTYAKCLGEVGKDQEALLHAKLALDIWQRLAQNKPDVFEPDYAKSLSNYATNLRNAGKDQEALIHTKQALDIRQRLVENKPDRFEPDYAVSMSNYATNLRDAGKDEESLIYAKQALDIRQRLAQSKPERYEPDYAMSLNNYAIRLSESGKDEEALKYAKQAMDINQRLTQNGPERYEPDYAMSLNNYAIRLSDAGKDEEALKHAKQALDIRQRLAQSKPDRFESDYASSLSNYASRLSVAGKDEEALKYAKQALDIHQRLAKKNEERYIEEQLHSTCYVHFLRWLSDKADSGVNLTDLSNIPTKIPAHRRPLSQLYISFVLACWSPTQAARSENFKNVIIAWNALTRAHKTQAQEYWLCAAAWSAKFAPAAVAGIDWQSDWHQYVKQRQGRIPHWMNEVARRMEFRWPE